jgi:acetolactate synthase-1/2/3 large subunit
MNGGELLCRTLEALGVTHVFGLPGTQTVPLFDALRRSRLHTVVPTHELSASFMLAGYFRASGRVGVLTTIPGPGFTYALTGLAEARLDSTPLVYVVGRPATAARWRYQLQAIDQTEIAAPLVKRIFVVERASDLAFVVAEAFAVATGGEPGPVMVHLGPEIAREEASWRGIQLPATPAADARAVEEVAALLAGARRVLLLAGQGTVGASEALRTLAERLGAPVVATTSARGVLPEDHPLSFVFDLRATDALNELAAASDLVVALGVKFSHNASAGFQLRLPAERLLHIDASAEVLGANYPARWTFRADVPALLGALVGPVEPHPPGRGWSGDALDNWRRKAASASGGPEPTIHGGDSNRPAEFFRCLREVLPRDGCVVTDSGLHQLLTRWHFRVLAPRGLIVPTDFQSMGFGLPAAIGAKLAQPDRTVVALIGDGGLAMCGLELLTAVRERLGLPVIVFRDGKYGLIRMDQLRDYGVTYGVDLPPLDPAALAAATGAEYCLADRNLAAGLRAAIRSGGPTVLDVPVGDSLAIYHTRASSLARATGRRLMPPAVINWLKRRG